MLLYICKINKKGKNNMDIQIALNKLNGFFDMLFESGFLFEEEKLELNEVENTITSYVNERK